MCKNVNQTTFGAFSRRLYSIGQEERFQDRVKRLCEYLESKGAKAEGHLRVQYADTVSLDVRISKDVYESCSKTQYSKYKTLERKKKYYYIKVYERNTQGKTKKEPLVVLRCDLSGAKMELCWLSKGKYISGKNAMRLFNLFYRGLRPGAAFLHDASCVSVKLSPAVIREDVRRQRKRARRRMKKPVGRPKKKAMKKTRKNVPNKKVTMHLLTVRALATGKTWYESMGFKPAKVQDIRYFYNRNIKSKQHPAQFRSSVDTLRKMTMKELYSTFPSSSHKNMDDIREQIGVSTPNSSITLGTVTKRVLSQVRRRPDSLRAQRSVKKFKTTFLEDHTKRMEKENITRKLSEYTKHLKNIWNTRIFKKNKPDVG